MIEGQSSRLALYDVSDVDTVFVSGMGITMAGLTSFELDAIAAECADNIVALIEDRKINNPELYDLAMDLGPAWYPYANSLADRAENATGWNINQTGGFISALSPMTRWSTNERDFNNYVYEGIKSKSLATIRAGKCDKIAALDNPTLEEVQAILNGDKTVCFVDNIVHPFTSKRVTIDTIMCQAMKLAKNMLDKRGVYARIERMITDLAAEYGFERAHDFQAFVWILFRGEAF